MVMKIEGQKKIELNLTPTLIIMEGTTAGKIGYRVKQSILKHYGDIPIIKYLWVDTDVNIPGGAQNWFSEDERAELVGYNANEILQNIENYPTIQEWWPQNAHVQAGKITRGAAQQMRLIGRLSLFVKFNESDSGATFISKFEHAIESIHQIENFTKTREKTNDAIKFNVSDKNTRVIFIFSTCGGTGSSISFDLAYLCRRFLRGHYPELMAFSVLPPVIDPEIKNETTLQRRKIRANTYAWFKEDQYLMEHPHWFVEYPGIAPVDVANAPFDVHFVFDMVNEANNRLDSSEDIYKMMAQAIFLDTGTAIAGENSSFLTNVSVLDSYTSNRRQAYSSLASASIVFPSERLQKYCGTQFAYEILDNVLYGKKQSDLQTTASTAISELGVDDETVVRKLRERHSFELVKKPAILKSDSVKTAMALLSSQFQEINKAIDNEVELIIQRQSKLELETKEKVEAFIAKTLINTGVKNAEGLIEVLRAQDTPVVNNQISSLHALQNRIALQGVSEVRLSNLREKYDQAVNKLVEMDGNLLHSAQKVLTRKQWEHTFDERKKMCVSYMEQYAEDKLTYLAQNKARDLYGQLITFLQIKSAELESIDQTMQKEKDNLQKEADDLLEPQTIAEGIFELKREVLGDKSYFLGFYKEKVSLLIPSVVFAAISENMNCQTLESIKNWVEFQMRDDLITHSMAEFSEAIDNISLLEAVQKRYPEDAEKKIEAYLNDLLAYCSPFWQFERNKGRFDKEGKSIIGVQDKNHTLIPERFRLNRDYNMVSTGFKHSIDVVRVKHGVPAFLLRDMNEYKAMYDLVRKEIKDPLQILPNANEFEDIFPDEHKKSRQQFAVGLVFGFIVQIGSFYYVDLGREYIGPHKIKPAAEFRLDQGRSNAEEMLIHKPEFQKELEDRIEKLVQNMGNKAAIDQIEEAITELKRKISSLPPNNEEMRPQLRKEVTFLRDYQRMLGAVGKDY